METTKKCDVAIIGGGIIGPASACFMGRRGYNVQVFEKRPDFRKGPPTQGMSINLVLSNRGRQALSDLGLGDEIINSSIPVQGRHLHPLNGERKSVPYDSRSKQCIYSISRTYLNRLLLNATEKYPTVSLNFNHKLIKVDLENGIIYVKNLETEELITVKAHLIIGADGAFSRIRREMQTKPMFTYSQTFIEHGYKELNIAPEQGKLMVQNHLHCWPRDSFLMVALPNKDGPWTITLTMLFEKFRELNTEEKVIDFFDKNFPDALPLIGKDELIKDFFKSGPLPLVSIKCSRFHHGKAVIIGDAAHAMVPFFGQGMNSGFEDCYILDKLLNKHSGNFENAIKEFSKVRTEDAQVICDLAMYNYMEMRTLVTKKTYHLRKKFDHIASTIFPEKWIPLYSAVAFTNMKYKACLDSKQWQDKMVTNAVLIFVVIFGVVMAYFFKCVF